MAGAVPEAEDFKPQTASLRDNSGVLRAMRTELREMRTEPRADRRVVFEGMRAKRAALFAMIEVVEAGDPGAGA
jgi:hypothetical protein